jgi:surfeit locus 1 family protein
MRVRFRPLIGFTLFFLPMFLLLVGLGVWQLQRLQWKLALIAEMTRNLAAPPIDLKTALALGARAQYRQIALTGRFENSKEAYIFATGPNGAPVYHILTPLNISDGAAVLIDRGIVPTMLRDPRSRPGSEPVGQVNIVGVWRTPDKPGLFTPTPDFKHRVWFARDLAGIAQEEHLKLAAPAIVEAEASPASGDWPRGGQTRIDIPNDHLQYALTWFLLSGSLLVFYFAYHRAQGRLEFGTVRKRGRMED